MGSLLLISIYIKTGKPKEFQTNLIGSVTVKNEFVYYLLSLIKFSVKKRITGNWKKKYWKSWGILSVRKSGNPVTTSIFLLLIRQPVSPTFYYFRIEFLLFRLLPPVFHPVFIKMIFRPCSHLTSAFAFFFDLCRQMHTLSMNTIICCCRSHS